MSRLRFLFLLAVAVFCFVSMVTSQAVWAKDTLIMGVHPYKPAKELHDIFKPIADYVAQKIGKPVELQIAKNYDDAVDKVGKGEFDFSFLGPTIYAKAKDKYNVIPLAQIVNKGKPTFSGVIIVKKGSGISSLKDFKGKKFAFGDRESTLTHLLPLYMLMDAGINLSDLGKYAFVGSHDNVALGVLNGSFDGGGLMPDIAEKYIKEGLEIIAKTPELPEHVFVATKSMNADLANKIQNAVLNMESELYKKIKGSLTGMQKFDDKDFDILRKIFKKVGKEMEK